MTAHRQTEAARSGRVLKLRYVMDPLCGWCYGGSAAITALHECHRARVDFDLLPGGMWAGAAAKRQTPALARLIRGHDEQVRAATGMEFGAAYFASLGDASRLLDSEPPSRAIVTARHLAPARQFAFAAAVQAARFRDGRDLNDEGTYRAVCAGLGMDAEVFMRAYASAEMRRATQAVFAEAARYARAYPTLVAERDGEWQGVAEGYEPRETVAAQLDRLLENA